MLSKWHRLEYGPGDEPDTCAALATAPLGSPWFDGHFPGQPILPGIAMIAMAFEAARQQELKSGAGIRLKSVTRVRFKKPVRPDEQIEIKLDREQRAGDASYRFTILVGNEAGCTGILHTEPLAVKN